MVSAAGCALLRPHDASKALPLLLLTACGYEGQLLLYLLLQPTHGVPVIIRRGPDPTSLSMNCWLLLRHHVRASYRVWLYLTVKLGPLSLVLSLERGFEGLWSSFR